MTEKGALTFVGFVSGRTLIYQLYVITLKKTTRLRPQLFEKLVYFFLISNDYWNYQNPSFCLFAKVFHVIFLFPAAREELKIQSKYHDTRLSKQEFSTFVDLVVGNIPGRDTFEYFVEFLTNSVEVLIASYLKHQIELFFPSKLLYLPVAYNVTLLIHQD